MSTVPSIANSAMMALQRGWAQVDRGAAEIVSATFRDPADRGQDIVDLRTAGMSDDELLLDGVRDLMLGKWQAGAGALLMHEYSRNRENMYEMLRP